MRARQGGCGDPAGLPRHDLTGLAYALAALGLAVLVLAKLVLAKLAEADLVAAAPAGRTASAATREAAAEPPGGSRHEPDRRPRTDSTQPRAVVLAVVDITGSMNVRDHGVVGGGPASRLDTAKAALRALLPELPCGSSVALGLFTDRRPFLLFTPVEVCADFAPLDGAIAALDPRMAWEGDSRIAAGLFRAVALAGELDTDLIFVTDGQETPPLPASGGPAFEGKPGAIRGLIVGAGG